MATFIVRYECVESYEREYEADSQEDAEQMYYEDDKLFESSPRWSEVNLIDVEEVDA